MPFDEKLEKSEAAAQLREQMESTVQSRLMRSGLAGVISLIPFGVGSCINAMLADSASSRIHQRVHEMFEEAASRIHELTEKQINKDWFRSEEFQTLLFEAIDQLRVTHDRRKIGMLGKALANSGSKKFSSEERKELFIQLIRDLTPSHVAMLRRLDASIVTDGIPAAAPDQTTIRWLQWQRRKSIEGKGHELLLLQMLAANGLAGENLQAPHMPHIVMPASQAQARQALEEFFKHLQQPPRRLFQLSDLGNDFLEFVGARGN
jgi:hypothetical protein